MLKSILKRIVNASSGDIQIISVILFCIGVFWIICDVHIEEVDYKTVVLENQLDRLSKGKTIDRDIVVFSGNEVKVVCHVVKEYIKRHPEKKEPLIEKSATVESCLK